MATTAPKATDLFSDADTAKEAALRNEEYNSELSKALGTGISDPSAIMAIKSGAATFAQASGSPVAALEALAANKSLSPDALAGLNNALAAQRVAGDSINKEITLLLPIPQ